MWRNLTGQDPVPNCITAPEFDDGRTLHGFTTPTCYTRVHVCVQTSMEQCASPQGQAGTADAASSVPRPRRGRTTSRCTSGNGECCRLGDFQHEEEHRLTLQASLSSDAAVGSIGVSGGEVPRSALPSLPLPTTDVHPTGMPHRLLSGRRSTSDNCSSTITSGIALPASVVVDDLFIGLVRVTGPSSQQHAHLQGFSSKTTHPIYLVRPLPQCFLSFHHTDVYNINPVVLIPHTFERMDSSAGPTSRCSGSDFTLPLFKWIR